MCLQINEPPSWVWLCPHISVCAHLPDNVVTCVPVHSFRCWSPMKRAWKLLRRLVQRYVWSCSFSTFLSTRKLYTTYIYLISTNHFPKTCFLFVICVNWCWFISFKTICILTNKFSNIYCVKYISLTHTHNSLSWWGVNTLIKPQYTAIMCVVVRVIHTTHVIMQSVPIMRKMKGFTSKWVRGTLLCSDIIHTTKKRHHIVYSPSQLHVDRVNVQTVQDVKWQCMYISVKQLAFWLFVPMINHPQFNTCLNVCAAFSLCAHLLSHWRTSGRQS